jgi:GT2 family glycosyltransferase
MSAPRLSIIIPTWNRADLVLACLASLDAQTWQDFEVVVVDDGSSDDTARQVAAAHPAARVLHLAENRGFAVATNTGLRAARAPWLFLLNNDMTLAPDALEHLMRAAESGAADLLTPLVCWQGTPDRVYAAGDRIRAGGRPESIGHNETLAGFVPPATIFGVTFGAGLVHRRVFDRVGMLAEDFVAYFEDADFCFRARLAGFRAACVPDARAWHVGSASLGGNTHWRTTQCHRNHALLVLRNYPIPLLLRHAPALVRERWHQHRRVFSSARAEGGAWHAARCWWRAETALWRALPGALRARRGIQRGRVLSVRALAMLLERGP